MNAVWLVLENLALLAAGWYGRDVVESAAARLRKRRRARLMSRLDVARSTLSDWVIRYYVRGGQESHIFTLENGKPLPYLTRPEWWKSASNPISVTFSRDDSRSAVAVDPKTIESRRRLGQKVWDGSIYYLSSGISDGTGGCDINLGRASYFQYLTVSGRMETEGLACQRSPRRHRPVFRDQVAPTIGHLQSARPGAQLLGFTVAVLLATRNGPRLLIQDRSRQTGVAGGRCALIPAYVCEPRPDGAEASRLPLGDFLREFIEELYPNEYDKSEGSLSADWYHDTHPVPELLQMHRRGTFIFDILGLGFDAMTTELHVGAVAFVNNADFAEKELRRMRRSWEADGIDIVEADARTISRLAQSERTYATSAFTLMRLKAWLEERHMLG